MVILGIDIETTGLEPQNGDEVTEIAYVLYNLGTHEKLFTLSALVKGKREVPKDITILTGITNEMRETWGLPKEEIKPNLKSAVEQCDYIAAHNANFEKAFLGNLGKPWIDTATDVPYPAEVTTRKLTHLAAEHGVYVRGAHRALEDVGTMLEVISQYNCEEIKRFADSPTVLVQAQVTFDERELAKARGYRWNPDKKMWWKALKEFQLSEERKEAEFSIVEIVDEADVGA